MTATGTRSIVEQIEEMMGLSFDQQKNVVWPSPEEMSEVLLYKSVFELK
jgi:hypothetical protein